MLTALLAVFSITVIVDLRGIERDLYEQAEVARPRSATARQVEIHLLGYALAVRSFLHLKEARFLQDAGREAAALDAGIAQYAKLARTPRQQDLAARFSAGWKEYREFADRVTRHGQASSAESEKLVVLRLALEKLLNEEIQPEAAQAYDEIKTITSTRMQAIVRLAAFLLVAGLLIGGVVSIVVTRAVAGAQSERKV